MLAALFHSNSGASPKADILGIKQLGINYSKKKKDLDTESWKTLLKKTKEDTNNWKDIRAHGLKDGITKMPLLSKAICTSNAIPAKIQ